MVEARLLVWGTVDRRDDRVQLIVDDCRVIDDLRFLMVDLLVDEATDIEIHAKEILEMKDRLNKIYSKHTKKSEADIKKALERDKFMTPEEAKQFGLIDEVVEKRS